MSLSGEFVHSDQDVDKIQMPCKRRGQSRSAIIDAARRLLHDGSYHSLNIEAIADMANLSRRTVYNQFANKDDIYRASREALLTEVSELIDDEIADGEPIRALGDFARNTVALLKDERHIELLMSIVRDGQLVPWLAEAYHRRIKQPLIAALEIFLHRQVAQGLFIPLDARLAAFHFLGIFEAMIVAPKIFGAPAKCALPLYNEQIDALTAAFAAQYRPPEGRWIGTSASTRRFGAAAN